MRFFVSDVMTNPRFIYRLQLLLQPPHHHTALLHRFLHHCRKIVEKLILEIGEKLYF